MPFIAKRVHASGSLRDDLREWRERAGCSIEQAAAMTKVLPSVIRAWERGQWTATSTDRAYVERMMVAYAQHFSARPTFIQKKLREEWKDPAEAARSGIAALQLSRGFDKGWGLKLRALLVVVLLAGGLGTYMVVQASAITEPPILEILSPVDGQKLDRPVARIEGKTLPEASVYINEQQASIREDGVFSLELDVPRGTTEIFVRAKKRHSRESEAVVRVVYDPEEQAATSVLGLKKD